VRPGAAGCIKSEPATIDAGTRNGFAQPLDPHGSMVAPGASRLEVGALATQSQVRRRCRLPAIIRAVIRKVCSYCRRVFLAWPSDAPDVPVFCCMGHFIEATRRKRGLN
jgi:hypothetical protein